MISLDGDLIIDSDCRADPELGHEIATRRIGRYECESCGHVAHYHYGWDRWVVTRPFIITEIPW